MVKRIVKQNYWNFALLLLGVGLFFGSFHLGEHSLFGGMMHLIGCAFFCSGVHGLHDTKMEEEVHPHGHH